MLGDRLVELEVVESISTEAVRQVLKKHHQTLASGNVVYPAEAGCRLRVCDGAGT